MDELTRMALAGTSKHSGAAAVDSSHPAEALAGQLASDDREHVFLLRAAARAVYTQCGQVARTDIEPLAAAPDEVRGTMPAALSNALQHAMVTTEAREVLVEFLRQLDEARLLLLPELLPQALSLSDTTIRQHLLPVLGERGRWLSQFQPDWQWVTTGIEQLSQRNLEALRRVWEEGNIGERCRTLEKVRQADAAVGRSWLEEVLEQEKADHRARLLATLAVGLTLADEPLLETRLEDRSDAVRQTAAQLLGKIPGSALAERMQQRAREMFTAQRDGGRGKGLKLVCQPPEKIDSSWQRDAVPNKERPGRGKRSIWVESVLASVPPAWFQREFDAQPTDLLEAIADDDYALAVLTGWTRAAIALAERDAVSAGWLRPLWHQWLKIESTLSGEQQRIVFEYAPRLLQALPDADDALRPLLGELSKRGREELIELFLPALRQPWSESFGREYLSLVRSVVRRQVDQPAYQWASTLQLAGRALPRTLFPAALEPWEVAGRNDHNWHTQNILRQVEKFSDTIQFRKHFYEQLAQAQG